MIYRQSLQLTYTDSNLKTNDINILLKELSLSDLIYEIDYVELDEQFFLILKKVI